jgi:hypothetical protein
MAENIIDLRDTMQSVEMTVRIKHERETRWRIWLGAKVIILAAWIMGCNIVIERDGDWFIDE